MLQHILSRRVQHYLNVLVRVIIAVTGLVALARGNWLTAVSCVGILFCTYLPAMISKRLDDFLPPEMEFMAILFAFFSLFLGEIHGYYQRFWWWDAALHTVSGVLLGIVAFMLVYVLNSEERVRVYMKPGFVAVFSFTFAVAFGVIWEIFEFAMDSWFGLNMQKSGLVDTMWDLIVASIGALIAAVGGYIYLKSNTMGKHFDAQTRNIRSGKKKVDVE